MSSDRSSDDGPLDADRGDPDVPDAAGVSGEPDLDDLDLTRIRPAANIGFEDPNGAGTGDSDGGAPTGATTTGGSAGTGAETSVSSGGSAAPRDESLPTIVGFSDLIPIGRGGFSTVYSAVEEQLHRRVAIKVVSGDDDAAARLERELRALGMLDEVPNIISAHSVVRTSRGQPALIMRLFSTSLSRLVRSTGPQPFDRVNRWAAQLAAGLDAAHERGVIHRDVKPENVLLDEAENAYLADFGIAALATIASGTSTVMSISPPHAPPERLNGASTGDILGDIYSLASTLYFALTGTAPFGTTKSGGAAGLIERIVNQPLPEHESLTGPVADVFKRAMSKDPTERYTTAGEFAAALAAASPGAAPLTDPPTSSTTGTSTGPVPVDRMTIDPTTGSISDTPGDVSAALPSDAAWLDSAALPDPARTEDHEAGDAARPEVHGAGDTGAVARLRQTSMPAGPPTTDGSSGPSGADGRSRSHGDGRHWSQPPSDGRTGDGPRRRGAVLVGAVVVVIAAIVVPVAVLLGRGDDNDGSADASAHAATLDLYVENSTKQNPLPDDFHVTIGSEVVDLSGLGKAESTRAVAVDAFAEDERVNVVVELPERHSFTVSQKGKVRDGKRVDSLVITDGWVQLGDERRSRKDSSTDEQVREERERITALILDSRQERRNADKQFSDLFEEKDGMREAPSEVINSELDDNLLPLYNQSIAFLDIQSSTDMKSQIALSTEKDCAAAKLKAFERVRNYNDLMSEDDNAKAQNQLWEDATKHCDAANAARDALKSDE